MRAACNEILQKINNLGLGVDRFEQGVYKKQSLHDSDPTMDRYYRNKWFSICNATQKVELDAIKLELELILDGLKQDPLSKYINKQIKKEERERYGSFLYSAYRNKMPEIERKYIRLAEGMSIEERAFNYITQSPKLLPEF